MQEPPKTPKPEEIIQYLNHHHGWFQIDRICGAVQRGDARKWYERNCELKKDRGSFLGPGQLSFFL